MLLLFLFSILPLLIVMYFVLKKTDKPNAIFFLIMYLPILIVTQYFFFFYGSNSSMLVRFTEVSYGDYLAIFCINSAFYSLVVFIYYFFNSISSHKDSFVKLDSQNELSFKVAMVFFLLGVINFLWNVYTISSFDFVKYFQTISVRREQFNSGGTTVFYLFSMFAGFIFTLLFSKRKISVFYFLLIMLVIAVIVISRGRITNTLSYLICIVVLFYKNNDFNTFKFTRGFSIAIVSVFMLYLYRVYSSYTLNGYDMDQGSVSEMVTYYLFDKANTPNILLELFIFKNYSSLADSPMFGISIFSSILKSFLIDSSTFIPSVYLKENYFMDIGGGALPPTMPGEAILNFGLYGLLIFPFIFGFILFFLDYLYRGTKSVFVLIVVANIIGYFVFISPKGEFDNFPFFQLLVYWIVFILYKILIRLFKAL